MTPPQGENAVACVLACAIVRGAWAAGSTGRSAVSKRFWKPEDEVYWHTREACAVMAKDRGVFWAEVVKKIDWAESLNSETVRACSEPVWVKVAHPAALVEEVMSG